MKNYIEIEATNETYLETMSFLVNKGADFKFIKDGGCMFFIVYN